VKQRIAHSPGQNYGLIMEADLRGPSTGNQSQRRVLFAEKR